jgi:hypothetical protein
MSLQEHRPLIVRSNRTLGSLLLERKLITSDQLDAANEKLLEHLEKDDLRRASILHVLIFEMQVLNEDNYLEAVIEKYGIALMDLHSCQFKKIPELSLDFTACWATWTIPFDVVDDFYLIGTLLYPSPQVVKFWSDKYAGKNIIWYALTVRSFQAAMEKLEQLKAETNRTAHALPAKTSAKPSGGTKPPHPSKK